MDPLLRAIAELVQRDAALARRIDELVGLENEIAALRARAAAAGSSRERLPTEQAAARDEVARAEAEAARRTELVRAAESELARARDEGRSEAERALATAESSLRTATTRLGRARMELARLEREAEQNETEAERIVERARALATRADEPLREDVEPWGARARAKVFAERTHAEAERQRVIEEAEEIGSSVTGESLAGANVSTVARRVEAVLAPR